MAPYDNSLWFIETNVHPLLESATSPVPKMVNYLRPSFWSRFVELNSVMWATNAGLTERHAYDSRPQTWPVLRRGINFWTKDHRQIYLIGNPFIWWGALCAIMVYFGGRAFLMLRAKRGCKDFQDTMIVYYDQTMGFLALGWAMHFLPFFTMHRQLFIHHYLPALYFSILLLAALFDLLTSGLRPKYRFLAAMVMILIAFASYSTYAPVTYATPWTQKGCERARLLKTWDLNCKDFPQDIKEYKTFGSPIHSKASDEEQGQHHLSSSALGTITADVLQQANAAQAGNHPFEQAPQQAASSGVAQASSGQIDGKREPDKVQADAAPPEPAAAVAAGTAEALPGQAVLEAEEKQRQKQAQEAVQGQAPAHGVDPKALDAEGLEGLVLSGTSLIDQSKTSASAATTPSHAA